MVLYFIRYLLTRIYLLRNLTLNSHSFLMINDHALTVLSKINCFWAAGFFFGTKNRVSQGLTEFIWDHSLLLLKLERYFWFLLTCVSERKKVWVNFKRKVLYFRSSNHTSGEIRPATKSDIEVKTVSVTSVVEWHRPGICTKYFHSSPQNKIVIRENFYDKFVLKMQLNHSFQLQK